MKALEYYCEVLGFKKYFDDAILGVERTMFAGVSRNRCSLVLDQHDRRKVRVGITSAAMTSTHSGKSIARVA